MWVIKWIFAYLALACFAGSFLGEFHGAGDALAAFRIENVLVLLGLSLWFFWRRNIWIAGSLAICGIVGVITIAPFYFVDTKTQETPLVLYQKNLGAQRINLDSLFQDIDSVQPDFLTFQELSLQDTEISERVQEAFPYVLSCFSRPKGALLIASKYPIVQSTRRCSGVWGLAKMQVETPNGPLWVVGMHSYRPLPWPYVQNKQALKLQKYMPDPVDDFIIAGDFNAVPWGRPMLKTQSYLNAKYLDKPRTTFTRLGLIRLSIDHILMSQDMISAGTQTRPRFGSDHYGLVGHFTFRP
jgi:endonuclease/exonuclease/phosphatase (EEP) superfamily protein YafD